MKSIVISFMLMLLLFSPTRVGSISVEDIYEFKIEKDINLLRQFHNDTNLKYEKNTHFEFSKRVTINEYNSQNKVVSYTIANSIQYQFETIEYNTKLDLSNYSFNKFLIPTLLVSSLNSTNYIVDIIFYESLDLPVDPYPFVIFGTEVINQALISFQSSDVDIPGISLMDLPLESSQFTLHTLLENASSYNFMGASSIDQGIKNVSNDTKSWNFDIKLENFQIYNEILNEYWKYNFYNSGIKLSYTDDLILSVLESNIDYIAEGLNYIETKSTMYRVMLIEDGGDGFKVQDILQMPTLSALLLVILLILIIKNRKDVELDD